MKKVLIKIAHAFKWMDDKLGFIWTTIAGVVITGIIDDWLMFNNWLMLGFIWVMVLWMILAIFGLAIERKNNN